MIPQGFLPYGRTAFTFATALFLTSFSAGVQVSVPLCPLLRTRLGLGFADQVGVHVYVVEDGNAGKVGSGIDAFISYEVDFHDEICW